MITVIVNGKKVNIESKDTSLHQLLADNGFDITAPCGGKGTCGKCLVTVDGRKVLACQTMAKDGMTVELDGQVNSHILADALSVGETIHTDGFGVALDLGTTTIAASLYNLATGEKVKTIAQMNKQKTYGADVISRCEHWEKMHSIIISQINDIIREMKEEISLLCIAGNTIMEHFVLGLDPRQITVAPFTPVTTSLQDLDGAELNLNCKKVVVMPSVSGYVGGDIVAGILATELHKADKPCILLDIGTNGEIVVGSKDGIYCCSAAAGPAFEGANISCGMSGVEGAISSVSINDGAVSYKTVGDKNPVGICGSGILDAVAEFLKCGIIDETGYLEDDFVICDGVVVTPKDIREVQLAKGAIAAGINVLLKKTGITCDDIDKVYLAGGFGNYLNKDSAAAIGLIPKPLLPKVECVGNTSLGGASSALLTGSYATDCTDIGQSANYIELSCDIDFQNEYIEQMMF